MPRRAEFYFDGTYYRKRIKLPDGRWKDVRARTKEELRSKLYDMETAQRMGLVLDAETTVAELAVEWYTNRSAGLSAARQGDYRIAINHHICPVIGAMRVRDVKPEHCQRVMAQALRDEKKRTNSEFVLHTSDGSHLTYQSARNIVSVINRRCPMTEGQRRERIEQERGRPIASRKPQKNITKLTFRVTPHQLRHTYATRLVESGMNIKQIQYLLGHDDVHLTLSIYSHVTQNRPEELTGAVSAAFSAPQEPALESV